MLRASNFTRPTLAHFLSFGPYGNNMEGSTTKPAAQPGQQREWSTVEWMDQSLGKYVSIKKLVDILCTRARNEKIRNEEGNPIKKSDLQIVV